MSTKINSIFKIEEDTEVRKQIPSNVKLDNFLLNNHEDMVSSIYINPNMSKFIF